MKKLFLFLMLAVLLSQKALAGREGGGGDFYEPVFKDIAENIEGWIASGNGDSLRLPDGTTITEYKRKMLSALSSYHIIFTPDPVLVNGKPKTCKNYVDESNQNQILCNHERFDFAFKHNIDGLYRNVHHEFAGLEGLEVNSGQDSDYRISNQLSKVSPAPEPRHCIDGHEGILAEKIGENLKSKLFAFGVRTGIHFDPNSLQLTVDCAVNNHQYGSAGCVIATDSGNETGSVRSDKGTEFQLRLAWEMNDQWFSDVANFEPHLKSNGFDSEGNPRPPVHCAAAALNPIGSKEQVVMIVQNLSSGKVIAKIPVLQNVPLF